MDIKQLVSSVNSKVSSSLSYYDTKLYTDEPIIRTAAQLDGYLPEEYKRMKKIATDFTAVKKSEQQIFYEQAKFMEAFSDDYFYSGEFRCFNPTYSAMNDKQLRAYFSWRSGVRRGVAEETSLSYVYVYIYELLATVGAKEPSLAFKKLYYFWNAYRRIEPRLDTYVPLWLKDMVVYYNLERSLLDGIYDFGAETAAQTLISNDEDDNKLFDSICFLSAYKYDGSSFFKQNKADCAVLIVQIFRELFNCYEKRRSSSFAEKLFGRRVSCPYHIFSSAVFFDNSRYTDYTYKLSPIHTYHSANGKWNCERYYGNLKNNKEIGNILKFIDCKMRKKSGFRYTLKEDEISCSNKKLIERIIDKFFSEKRKADIPIVSVDANLLSSIRGAADEIMDRLIVEPEEEIEETVIVQEPALLTQTEKEFLLLLLSGDTACEYLREHNIMVSVAVDNINEKLYDRFEDNVIYFDGDTPTLFDDYADELKGMLK